MFQRLVSVTLSRQTTLKTPGGQITLWLIHPMLLKMDVQTQTMSLTHLVCSADILELKCGLNCSKNIAANMPFYERRSAVCLQMRSMNLETWVETITNKLVYCDEHGLMGLCYMYHRHCVVLTQNKLWSTVQADKPLNLLDLLNIYSVRLIYLGNLCFGVLTW